MDCISMPDGVAPRALRRGDQGRIELAGPLEVEPCAVFSAKAGVGERAVVIADGLRGQGNTSAKCVKRLCVAITEEGAPASIKLGPQAVGLQDDGAVEQISGRFKVTEIGRAHV